MRACVDELIECTIRYGGKVHLAKDDILKPDQFRRLFPRHGEFLAVKRRLDPEGLFSSNLFRRLFPDEARDRGAAGRRLGATDQG
jgi:decaprenylphospho-beta-D-ribofuranose 2-oxidase